MARRSYTLYSIQPAAREGERGRWVRVGRAWPNDDGSFNVKIDIFHQLDLQLREDVERDDSRSNSNQGRARR